MSSFLLLPGRLLINIEPPEDRTKSGLLYPSVEKVYASTAMVLHHDPHSLEENLTGKRIIFQKWSSKDFEWNGTTLSVIREGNVQAIIEE